MHKSFYKSDGEINMGSQAIPQQQQIMMQFNCPTCQGPVVGPQPQLRVFNAADVSAIVCTHTRITKCPGCGATYLCLIHPQGADQEGKIMFIWTPVQTKESAIVPGTQSNMKQAVDATDLGNKIKSN